MTKIQKILIGTLLFHVLIIILIFISFKLIASTSIFMFVLLYFHISLTIIVFIIIYLIINVIRKRMIKFSIVLIITFIIIQLTFYFVGNYILSYMALF